MNGTLQQYIPQGTVYEIEQAVSEGILKYPKALLRIKLFFHVPD